MTRADRLAWAKTATVWQWTVACATLVMGWNEHRGAWIDEHGNATGLTDDGYGGGGEPIRAWNPIERIEDSWLVHQRIGQGELRERYSRELASVILGRMGARATDYRYFALDMTPRDVCLAALLTVEEA
jgi:hypothetical protein